MTNASEVKKFTICVDVESNVCVSVLSIMRLI